MSQDWPCTFLLIGAGSVWRTKYRPAYERLLGQMRPSGQKLLLWIAEKRPPETDPLVTDWFWVDQPSEKARLTGLLDRVDVAIIATWNSSHIPDLRFLGGQVPVVLVEKPLSDSLSEAQSARKDLDSWGSAVQCFGVDHYVNKPSVRYLLRSSQSGRLCEEVGEIAHVSISIRERRGVEPGRETLLDRGLIDDMLPHAVQIVFELLQLERADEFQIRELVVAKYEGAPVSGETSARLEATVRGSIPITILLGKGQLDDKTVEVVGARGTVSANITTGEVLLLDDRDARPLQPVTRDDSYDTILREAINLARPIR